MVKLELAISKIMSPKGFKGSLGFLPELIGLELRMPYHGLLPVLFDNTMDKEKDLTFK